jgi:hypothetical protein
MNIFIDLSTLLGIPPTLEPILQGMEFFKIIFLFVMLSASLKIKINLN